MISQNLMKGDWVLHEGQIKRVDLDWGNGYVSLYGGETWSTIYDKKSKEECDPVPLTQEILYKNTYDENTNTYRVYNTQGVTQYSLSDLFIVRWYENETYPRYEGLPLHSVHELQHLLEIAGVDRKIVI